jgi:ribosomal protein S18 acetylase RimI-like enzyme
MLKQDFLNVDEICVDEAFRGQGIARAMIDFIREYAVKKGFHRIALNVWEFNQKAIEVYEAKGFHTYKRSMEMNV